MCSLNVTARHSVFFGYCLTKNRCPSGLNFAASSPATRETVMTPVSKSMSFFRSSISSPHRSPSPGVVYLLHDVV
jgi:hypothetical protein